MAIAQDATSDAALTTSPVTGSHTCTGSDRVLFVGAKGAAGYATSATYNGSSMTRINDVQSGVGEYNLSLFYIIAPSTGSNTVSVSVASGSVGFTGSSYTGADQTTQPDVSGTKTQSSTLPIVTGKLKRC